MRDRALRALALFLILTVLCPSGAGAGEKPVDAPKKVLVELYTSQGCSSCPPASDLLGKLFELGDGPDRIVPLNFHVDYFNQPWPDPYSDASYTRRQRDYNTVQRRDDLQFTPLLMVDGRQPLIGSDRAKAVAVIEQALKQPPEVALDLDLDGTGIRKTVSVKIAARSREVAGRELLIGVALTEDPVTTKVLRGENAGLTLVEHHVVRRLDHQFLKLDRTGSRTLTFPIELPSGRAGTRFRVTVFAQDRANGNVYQANEVPWNPQNATSFRADRARDLDRVVARRKARRAALNRLISPPGFDFRAMANDDSDIVVLTICPACGSLFNSRTIASNYRRPGQGFPPASATC
ncbi:MAG TPA: DUF1223 domain-containing protein [Isosphaeraceae bacterium]|nr:DUF1223 domain-containing protein [Isosphaeraceae bacterium]